MTTYTDPDGWTLVEDRTREPGAGLVIDHRNRYVGHPVDVYRRRFPGWTDTLDDAEILELWYGYEIDRRLTGIGLRADQYMPDRIRRDELHSRYQRQNDDRASWTGRMFTSRHDQGPAADVYMYPRPVVRRVHEGKSSWIEPALDESWSDLDKLRWKAAMVEHDAGLGEAIEIVDANHTVAGVKQPGYYTLNYRSAFSVGFHGASSFDGMWTLLNGIALGARIDRDAAAVVRAEVTW